jgi:hypothetical protein
MTRLEIGSDASNAARAAIAAAGAGSSPPAWHSPVRHSLRGNVALHSGIELLKDHAQTVDAIYRDVAEEDAQAGAEFARGLGLEAQARAPESAAGDWEALLQGARDTGAAALLVGSRGTRCDRLDGARLRGLRSRPRGGAAGASRPPATVGS